MQQSEFESQWKNGKNKVKEITTISGEVFLADSYEVLANNKVNLRRSGLLVARGYSLGNLSSIT